MTCIAQGTQKRPGPPIFFYLAAAIFTSNSSHSLPRSRRPRAQATASGTQSCSASCPRGTQVDVVKARIAATSSPTHIPYLIQVMNRRGEDHNNYAWFLSTPRKGCSILICSFSLQPFEPKAKRLSHAHEDHDATLNGIIGGQLNPGDLKSSRPYPSRPSFPRNTGLALGVAPAYKEL